MDSNTVYKPFCYIQPPTQTFLGFRYAPQRTSALEDSFVTKYGFHTGQADSRIERTKTSRFYCHRIFSRTQNSPYQTQPLICLAHNVIDMFQTSCHCRAKLARLQLDCSLTLVRLGFQTSNLIQSNRTVVVENKTQK